MTTSGISSAGMSMKYMQLLVTQLQNQNPLEPMNNHEMTGQLTQLGQLEQMENLSGTFRSVLAATEKSHAASMIGKSVQYIDANQKKNGGVVQGVDITKGNVRLKLSQSLTYTSNKTTAEKDVRLNELDQIKNLSSTDTITLSGTGPDGKAINGDKGIQLDLHNGQRYLTLEELLNKITQAMRVNGQETYVAKLQEGEIRVINKNTQQNVEKLQLAYNGSGTFPLPSFHASTIGLNSVTSISN